MINELTARISSLSESLKLKGFYPGGASDVVDAIETVLKDRSNTATLVPMPGTLRIEVRFLLTLSWPSSSCSLTCSDIGIKLPVPRTN